MYLDDRFSGGQNANQSHRQVLQAVREATNEQQQVNLDRENEPLNDFLQSGLIYYGGFPFLFPLGQGVGAHNKPPSEEERIFIMTHFSRIAANQRLLVSLHNVKFRCDNAVIQKAMVRTDRRHSNILLNVVNAENWQARSDEAMANPTGEVARELLHEILPSIMISGGRIPFSPLERGGIAPNQLIGLVRFMNSPCGFITLGPDETRTALVARIALSNHENPTLRNASVAEYSTVEAFWDPTQRNGNPNDFGEYADLLPGLVAPLGEGVEIWRKDIGNAISNDPAAIALMCQRILDQVLQQLFGILYDRKAKKQPVFNFSSQLRGIMGRAYALFCVSELMGKNIYAYLSCISMYNPMLCVVGAGF